MASPSITDDMELEEVNGDKSITYSSYVDGNIHPNLKLLSHSSNVLLHKCPRKYELYKLSNKGNEATVDMSFGHLVGFGTQEYLVSGSRTAAYMSMLLNWDGDLCDDESQDAERANKKKKSFWHGLIATDRFQEIAEGPLADYEVAHFPDSSGKLVAANELGFTIDFSNGFTVRGFLDSLLRHKQSGALCCYEGKTTGGAANEASYRNSGQTLGYSLVLDAVATRLGIPLTDNFDVKTVIYQATAGEWEVFTFTKSHTQRALWLKNILLDIKHIAEYAEMEYFPMQGESCYDFFRPCEYFGVCETNNRYMFGGDEVAVKVDDESRYTFHFTLDEIIAGQLAKLEG